MVEDLKSFQLLSYVHAKTLKTNVKDGVLQLSFRVDTKVDCNVRVSCCVTEEKNVDNFPVMFYTPNRDDYVWSMDFKAGMRQEVGFGMLNFKMAALEKHELTKRVEAYTPLVISVNYKSEGKYYTFIDYCVFV